MFSYFGKMWDGDMYTSPEPWFPGYSGKWWCNHGDGSRRNSQPLCCISASICSKKIKINIYVCESRGWGREPGTLTPNFMAQFFLADATLLHNVGKTSHAPHSPYKKPGSPPEIYPVENDMPDYWCRNKYGKPCHYLCDDTPSCTKSGKGRCFSRSTGHFFCHKYWLQGGGEWVSGL